MVRLVIDTDPGVDDAHAILAALAHPDARVEAITTVSGNVTVDKTTANACRILDVAGKDVPVYAGCDRALIARHGHAENVHGEDGLGGSGYPLSNRTISPEHAANALVRLANESPGELTLVAIGPLTNLAVAIQLDPRLPEKYRRLVMMGGAIHGRGNTTPAAEFNVYTDPEAAAMVFTAWQKFTLISWETTLSHAFTPAQVEAILALQTPRGEFFRRTTGHILQFVEQVLGERILIAADFLAIAAAIEPALCTKSECKYVMVELSGALTRGVTMVDWNGRLHREPNADLVVEMDRARLWEMFQQAFA